MGAKQNGILKVKGKLDDNVFYVRRGKHLIRKAPTTTEVPVALKVQRMRTALLNSMAGELAAIMDSYYPQMKSGDFYPRMQSRFRKEPIDDRCLLLYSLKGLELHADHPLSRMGRTTVSTQTVNDKFIVTLTTGSHPYPIARYEPDGYFHEIILLTWNAKDDQPAIQQQETSIVRLRGRRPVFEFSFPITGAGRWLLCQRQSLCLASVELEYLATMGMQIINAGSFDLQEQQRMERVLAERKEKEAADAIRTKNPREKIVKVQPKGYADDEPSNAK